MALRAPRLTEHNFALAVDVRETIVDSGSATPITIDDSHLNAIEAATLDVSGQVEVSAVVGSVGSLSYRSLNEAVATVDEHGLVTRVADGICPIVVRTPFLGRKVNVSCSRQLGQTTNVLTGFKAGTFAEACAELLELLVDGKSVNLYSLANFSGRTYVRNPDFWGAGLDLTCLPAGHSFKGTPEKGGVLITPKHLAQAQHYWLGVGDVSHFVTLDNVVHERTVVDRTLIAGSGDLAIIEYDEALPETITPAKLLPANWRQVVGNPYGDTGSDYDWVLYWTSRIPMFLQNKARQGWVFNLNATYDQSGSPYFGYHGASAIGPDQAPATNYTGNITLGESGGVLCFLLDNEPVACFAQHGGLGGPDLAEYLAGIEAACDPLEVTLANLSAFEIFD